MVLSLPTNLPPECRDLEAKYFEAKTLPEKIKTLEDYYSAIPKHKGTERLCSRIKRKLAKLRLEMEEKKRKKSTISQASGRYSVKKAGAAQVVILGLTSSGKSSLLRSLTNAKPEIGDYHFTTRDPTPGMMSYEDIQIQLVEAPALFEDASKGKGWGLRTLSLARNADGLILLIDLSARDPCPQLKTMFKELSGAKINIEQMPSGVQIERRDMGGLQFSYSGKFSGDINEIQHFLIDTGIKHAVVRMWGQVELDDVALSLVSGTAYKPTLVIANKIDLQGSEAKVKALQTFTKLQVISFSAKTLVGLEKMPKSIFNMLNITRIYTKRPQQEPTRRPLIARSAITVEDVAKDIHSAFYKSFKYAKIWGSSKYPGQRVGLKYHLKDGDTVELHV